MGSIGKQMQWYSRSLFHIHQKLSMSNEQELASNYFRSKRAEQLLHRGNDDRNKERSKHRFCLSLVENRREMCYMSSFANLPGRPPCFFQFGILF